MLCCIGLTVSYHCRLYDAMEVVMDDIMYRHYDEPQCPHTTVVMALTFLDNCGLC